MTPPYTCDDPNCEKCKPERERLAEMRRQDAEREHIHQERLLFDAALARFNAVRAQHGYRTPLTVCEQQGDKMIQTVELQ